MTFRQAKIFSLVLVTLCISCGNEHSRKSDVVVPNSDTTKQSPADHAAGQAAAADKAAADKAAADKAAADKAAADKAAADKAAADKAAADRAAADKAAADKILQDLKFEPNENLGPKFVQDVHVDGENVYVAGDGGLSLSRDGGRTWSTIGHSQGIVMNLISAVYAQGPNIYLAHPGFHGQKVGGISMSPDGGASWKNITTKDGLGSLGVNDIFAAGSRLYAATDEGVSISIDGGLSWTNTVTRYDWHKKKVKSVFASESMIYAVTLDSISVSSNGGLSWTNVGPIEGFNDIYHSVHGEGSKIYVGANVGVALSTDAGTSWKWHDIAIGYGIGETRPAIGVGVPMRSAHGVYAFQGKLFAATEFGISLSNDDGRSWVNKQISERSNAVFVANNRIYLATSTGLLEASLPQSP